MPEPLPSDPVELEKSVRSLVVTELVAAAQSDPEALRPRMQDRPRYVDSEAEWLKLAAIKHPQGNTETRVVFVEFAGPSEKDEGACDHTILTLSYSIDVLFGLADKRKDGSNSHDDFVAFVMRARERFKQNRTFGYARRELENKLLQTEVAARVEKTDFATVHRINLSLDVEVG